ncbi:MAG: hypothetical protein M1833_003382 [Piccolia ochrophora]|nr:MAG: hypothetical protein M1833_003382 [Piccolia ochrophora]
MIPCLHKECDGQEEYECKRGPQRGCPCLVEGSINAINVHPSWFELQSETIKKTLESEPEDDERVCLQCGKPGSGSPPLRDRPVELWQVGMEHAAGEFCKTFDGKSAGDKDGLERISGPYGVNGPEKDKQNIKVTAKKSGEDECKKSDGKVKEKECNKALQIVINGCDVDTDNKKKGGNTVYKCITWGIGGA